MRPSTMSVTLTFPQAITPDDDRDVAREIDLRDRYAPIRADDPVRETTMALTIQVVGIAYAGVGFIDHFEITTTGRQLVKARI